MARFFLFFFFIVSLHKNPEMDADILPQWLATASPKCCDCCAQHSALSPAGNHLAQAIRELAVLATQALRQLAGRRRRTTRAT
jgi:hypothetical protein